MSGQFRFKVSNVANAHLEISDNAVSECKCAEDEIVIDIVSNVPVSFWYFVITDALKNE